MNKKEFEKKIEESTNDILEDTLLDKDASLEDTRAIKYEDIIQTTTKEKISKVPWIAAIFLIIIISITFGYMFLNNNPQTIFTMTVDNFFLKLSDNMLDESYDISKGTIDANVNINDQTNNQENINLKATYSIDKTNGLSKVKAHTKNKEGKIIDIDIYNDGKNTYIYSEDIYDTYIKLNENYKMFSQKDIKIILNGLNQAIDKTITSEKINGKKIKYDNGTSSIDAYESKLTIDKNNRNRITKTIINSLKSNTEFINSLSNILGIKSSETAKTLDDFQTKLKEFFEKNEKTEIVLYTDRKTNSFIKGEIKGKRTYISCDKDGNFNIKNETNITGNIKFEKKKDKYIFDLNYEIEENGKKHKNNINIKFTNKKAANFGNVNIDNAKDINEISELEKITIYSKLLNNSSLNKYLKYVA